LPHYFVRADKKNTAPFGFFLEKFQITGNMHFLFLALHLLNRTRCGLGCVLGGELKENTTHAPDGIVRRKHRASIKGVTINCGWVGVARAGRVFRLQRKSCRFYLISIFSS
jgi:hypothetical protein